MQNRMSLLGILHLKARSQTSYFNFFSLQFSLVLFHLACFLLASMGTRVSYDYLKTLSPWSSKSPWPVE